MRHPSDCRGFALPWVVLTVAILAVLAAVAAPDLATIHDRARIASTATRLRGIAAGVTSFGTKVVAYPGRVSQLSTAITTSDRNTCHAAMSSTNVTNWQTNGPFFSLLATTAGLWTEIGRVNDSIPVRTSPGGTQAIVVDIPGVRAADAALLDAYIDGATGDTVTYNAPVNDTTTVHYRLLSSSAVRSNTC